MGLLGFGGDRREYLLAWLEELERRGIPPDGLRARQEDEIHFYAGVHGAWSEEVDMVRSLHRIESELLAYFEMSRTGGDGRGTLRR